MANVIQGEASGSNATQLKYTHEIIFITPSQVYECLHKHEQVLRARLSLAAYLGIALTSGSTVLTAKDYNALGLDSATWRALFVLITALAALAALVCLVRVLFNLRRASLDATVADMENRGSVVTADSLATSTAEIDL